MNVQRIIGGLLRLFYGSIDSGSKMVCWIGLIDFKNNKSSVYRFIWQSINSSQYFDCIFDKTVILRFDVKLCMHGILPCNPIFPFFYIWKLLYRISLPLNPISVTFVLNQKLLKKIDVASERNFESTLPVATLLTTVVKLKFFSYNLFSDM